MSVYSYHTFILPFVWEGLPDSKLTMDEFSLIFKNNANWVCSDIKDELSFSSAADILSKSDALTFYKEYQYFHPYVRKALYGYDENIVTNYTFMPGKVRNNSHYYIEKDGAKYDLLINGIKLKIFNTGIALFILECENHGFDAYGNNQASFEAVKNINDFGRRITLPFIPNDPDGYMICADKLTVKIDESLSFETDFRNFVREISTKNDVTDSITLTYMGDFIKNILGYGSDVRFTSKMGRKKDYCYIYPAIDDRMFVACCVCEKKESDKITKLNGDTPAYISDIKTSKSYYEFVFVDPADRCSCNSPDMRKNLLNDHTYTRWIEFGTLYSIANQSITMLTNAPIEHLIESFLTQYVQMCCLTLVQKCSVVHFQREASALSSNLEKSGKTMNRKTITKLMNLQERFVAYQSQLNFSEVSPQEQAIELYAMLRKFMFVDEESDSFNERLSNLENAADTNLDFTFNKIALIFAFVSCIIGFFDNFMNFHGDEGLVDNVLLQWLCSGFPIMAATLVFVILFMFRRRKK